MYIYIHTHALSLAGLGVHVSSLSESMNAIILAQVELNQNSIHWCTVSQQESLGCVVAWFHHEWQPPAYQVYAGLLFGLPLAVTSFNRFSRLLEALTRRYCQVLTSLYFDDATTTDVRSAKGSGQWAMNQLCLMIGPLFAVRRRQEADHAEYGHFLGIDPWPQLHQQNRPCSVLGTW